MAASYSSQEPGVKVQVEVVSCTQTPESHDPPLPDWSEHMRSYIQISEVN